MTYPAPCALAPRGTVYHLTWRMAVDGAVAPLDAELFEVVLQDGEEPERVDRERFVAVNLLTTVRGAVDWEASDVDARERRGNKRIKGIRQLVLDSQGVPPTAAFRLYEYGSEVLLQKAAAKAPMALPLRGVTVLPLEELTR